METSTRSDIWKFREEYEKLSDLMHSIGINVKEDSTISDVRVTSKAYAAGVAPATKLIGVNGRQFTLDVLRDALHTATNRPEPIELLVKNGEFYTTHRVEDHDGERYLHLERDSSKADLWPRS